MVTTRSMVSLSPQAFEGGGEMAPIGGKLLEPAGAFVGELVVFARRPLAALHPLVVHELFAPELGEEGVERAFLGGERGGRERRQDVADVDRAPRHNGQDRKL